VKTEQDKWGIVNREKRSKKDIKIEWEKYFRGLLGRVEERVIWKIKEGNQRRKNN